MSRTTSTPARLLPTFFLLAFVFATPAAAEDPFPRPAGLEPDVRFWIRIYSEVGTNGGLIHDSSDLRVVYDKLSFSKGRSTRSRKNAIEARKKEIATTLRTLGRGKRSGLSREQKRILALFPDGVSNKTLRAAATRVRFQLGQADKFRAGVVRSGAWRDHIEETLEEMGVPKGLAALPHVESSFTPTAYSRVGAAGLWQFTRSTGRRYMRVDHVVDERLDPLSATRSAAQLLAANKLITGTWPLAITAYNHGASGMRRAAKKLGTTDIETIVRRYKSRTFGFASRNFYVEFLAARQVDANREHYFGKLDLDRPVEHDSVELSFYARASDLAKAVGVSKSALRKANPALSQLVWSEEKFVPRGYTLRMPTSQLSRPLLASLEQMDAGRQYAAQTPDRTHRVRRGDTLSGIAARYGTSVRALASANKLRSRNRIRVGQVLRLPNGGGPPRRAVTPEAAPEDGLYTVRRGDSVSRIASRFGMSERELLALNSLRNRNRIYPGQSLRVSKQAATPPTQVAAAPAPEQDSVAPAPAKAVVVTKPAKSEPAREQTPPSAEKSSAPETSEAALASPEPPAELAAATDELLDQPAAIEIAALPPTTIESTDEVESDSTEASDEASELEHDLQADPADYSVADDDTIEIQPAETLGHIAEWLDVRASQLRRINGMRYGTPITTHARLKLDFSRVDSAEFERRRLEHHRALQTEFFERYEISGTRTHTVRRGDSIWNLSRSAGVPSWLLQQYNPDLVMGSLRIGDQLTIPRVRRHGDSS